MLLSLYVKNLALIEEAEVEFTEGLNILTGETGAGKSILIEAVGLALGGKATKDMIRVGADEAYVELTFCIDEKTAALLETLDVRPDEDGLLIITKKITPARSVSRINDETVTAARLKTVTGYLIDIHGQNEHQSLLHKSKHLEILDEYAKEETADLLKKTADAYREYTQLKEKLSKFGLDDETRRREADFTRFEIDEIENAGIRVGEEEELSAKYRRFSHAQRISECLEEAYKAVDTDGIGRALRAVESVAAYDEGLSGIIESLDDVESILSDLERLISDHMSELEFDESAFKETEDRLDLIRNLMAKYGNSEEAVLKCLEDKKVRLDELENYEMLAAETQKQCRTKENELLGLCEELSAVRKEKAKVLQERIQNELEDLGFLKVDFRIEVRRLDNVTASGYDEVEFLISTNPGSIPPRPLAEVASGGELSRVMLAIKTVLADADEIPTLIFDEIDAGISGRTAQKVSERLSYIARRHQVLCITHLPQIAAMADTHFEIVKEIEDDKTVTRIHRLGCDEEIEELARLLGGARITDAVRENASEMKRLADERKERLT